MQMGSKVLTQNLCRQMYWSRINRIILFISFCRGRIKSHISSIIWRFMTFQKKYRRFHRCKTIYFVLRQFSRLFIYNSSNHVQNGKKKCHQHIKMLWGIRFSTIYWPSIDIHRLIYKLMWLSKTTFKCPIYMPMYHLWVAFPIW